MKRQVLFLDRDGVINVDRIGHYVTKPGEFRFEPDALNALAQFRSLGYELIIVSNQAGVGDGIFSENDLARVHEHMVRELEKHGIGLLNTYYCLHGKEEGCRCRKPETGLFETAAGEYDFDKKRTFFIGDKASDMEAGIRFGLKTIFVRTGHGAQDEPKLSDRCDPDFRIDRITDAVPILKRNLAEPGK